MSKKKPLPLLEQVEITAFAAEGKAVARVNDLVIFRTLRRPGRHRRPASDAQEKQLLRSPHRQVPPLTPKTASAPCAPTFEVLRRLQMAHLSYACQNRQQTTASSRHAATHRKGGTARSNTDYRSRTHEYYRNKIEFSFSNKRWLTAEEISRGMKYDTQRTGIPYRRRLRQGARHRRLPPHGPPAEPRAQRIRNFALEQGISFLRPAQPDRRICVT